MCFERLPSQLVVATTVHTDCLGGGILNGNGRWYEAGLCLPDLVSLPTRRVCTTSPAMQVNVAGCNRLFMARSIDANGDAELRWYDLNNSSPDPSDGQGVTRLRRQANDPDLTIDAGGNAAFVRHDLAAGATTYDAAVIDTCPGSPQFGQNVALDPSLDDLSAASGVVRARVSMCPTAAVHIEVIRPTFAGDEVVHGVTLATCASCTSAPPPTGRCCTASGCAVTSLANCAAGPEGWTTGATCATACPAPAPILSLRINGTSSAPAGQPVTITLTARNTGIAPGTNVRIRFILNNFYYTSMSADNSGALPPNLLHLPTAVARRVARDSLATLVTPTAISKPHKSSPKNKNANAVSRRRSSFTSGSRQLATVFQ